MQNLFFFDWKKRRQLWMSTMRWTAPPEIYEAFEACKNLVLESIIQKAQFKILSDSNEELPEEDIKRFFL
jgi:hypothetical protein